MGGTFFPKKCFSWGVGVTGYMTTDKEKQTQTENWVDGGCVISFSHLVALQQFLCHQLSESFADG